MRNPYWNGEFSLTDKATEPGNRLARIFEPFFDGSTTQLRQIGTRDIQQEMDALAPYCDINYMLSQLKRGDTSVLSSRQAFYGDFSGLSSNPADVINLVNGASAAFGLLSTEERATYNNDWRAWLTALLSAGPVSGNSGDAAAVAAVVTDAVEKIVSDETATKEE